MKNCMFFVYFIVLSIYDIRSRKVPVVLVACGGAAAAGYMVYGLCRGENNPWGYFTAITPGLLLLTAAFVTKGIGYGDGLLLVAAGIMLGYRKIAAVFCISLFLTAGVSAVLLAFRKAKRNTRIPYIPFLTIAIILAEAMD